MSHLARSSPYLTAAFARIADARYTLGILESCGDGPIRSTVEPVLDERGNVHLVVLRIEIEGIPIERVLSAVSGGHGVPMQPTDAAQRTIARIA